MKNNVRRRNPTPIYDNYSLTLDLLSEIFLYTEDMPFTFLVLAAVAWPEQI